MNRLTVFLLFIFSFFDAFSQNAAKQCASSRINAYKKSNRTSYIENELARYDVHYYFLDLHVTPYTARVEGIVEIHSVAKSSSDTIVVELGNELSVAQVEVNEVQKDYIHRNNLLKIYSPYIVGEKFKVAINYSGYPNAGLYNSISNDGVTWTLSEPYSSKNWFPVKQSLHDKADSVTVWLTVPDSCKAGSNGVLKNVTNLGNNKVRFEWEHRHPIDYYLISLAVSEYDEYSFYANITSSDSVFVQNYIYSNELNLWKPLIDSTEEYLVLFSELFGSYPYLNEKYGHCMAPLGGGMEHQTMTTQDGFNKNLTAHELAHQWWGNYVTCASWKDIWLNEGFASYAENLMLETYFPGAEKSFMQLRHDDILSGMNGSVYVEDTSNVGRVFSIRLTYNKGAAIIHTLRYIIQHDSLFFTSMKNFLSTYSDSVATGHDFIQFMEDKSGKELSKFESEWYVGQGYPIYAIRWNKVKDEMLVEIKQNTSHSSVSYFTNPIDLLVSRINLPDTIIRVEINSSIEQFVWEDTSLASIKEIDPANWIINTAQTIKHDLSFVNLNTSHSTEVLVYPNPTLDVWNVKVEGSAEIVIFNSLSQQILESTILDDGQIQTDGLSSGVYLLKIKTQEDTKFVKLMKE